MRQFLVTSFQISVLLNPFAVLSTFFALTGEMSRGERANIMFRTCVASMIAGLVVLFSGDFIFSLLDISVDLFMVGGGVILMICAISLVWGKEKEKKFRSCGKFDPSISVVPLAIPMAVGPGAIVGLVVVGSEHANTMMNYVSDVGSLLVGVVVLGGVLSLGVWSDRVISKTTISIITRLTGLFVAAIAAKMILEGIRNYWNGF